MRLKFHVPLFFILFIIGTVGVASAQEQNDEEGVRGAFLTSRASVSVGVGEPSANTGQRPSGRRRPRRNTAGSTTKESQKGASKNLNSGSGSSTKNMAQTKAMTSGPKTGTGSSTTTAPTKALASTPLALGYTLYMRDKNGDAVRIDPAQEFHSGDRVRILLETNTDGYLYVFHTENNGSPEMIYPDARLDEGDNFIEAHVPTEIPSSQQADERLRWFAFYGQPATERLYFVLTREPLPFVPTGDNLVSYCQGNQNKCPWRPTTELWAQVERAKGERVLVTKEKSYGQAQTAREREAATRGLGLDQTAPAPSVIRMTASSSAPVLVTELALVHR